MTMIQFIGVGSIFCGSDQYHSNILMTSPSGKKMLLDCGGDARFALAEVGIHPTEIDAVYISHLHVDHIGGLEWLALSTFFDAKTTSPKLFGEAGLLENLWQYSLQGGLGCLGGKRRQLEDYFICHPLDEQDGFTWEQIRFELQKMPHVTGRDCDHCSYGLILHPAEDSGGRVFISTDSFLQPEFLNKIATETDLIFHDCETSGQKSGVHAHYDDLCTLPPFVKEKMWLYHYQPGSGHIPQKDGFLGFVQKGQCFTFRS